MGKLATGLIEVYFVHARTPLLEKAISLQSDESEAQQLLSYCREARSARNYPK